jgi:hypothetical protein
LTYIFFSEGIFKSGNVPERVLFPRNLNLLEFMTKSNNHQQKRFSIVQTIYIDNSLKEFKFFQVQDGFRNLACDIVETQVPADRNSN